MKEILSAEYVSCGHPDKVADLISDYVLNEYLKRDKEAHVACETLICKNLVVIAGEVNSIVKDLSYEKIVNDVLLQCGYSNKRTGFDLNDYKLLVNISEQSKDINYGVRNSYEYRNGERDDIADSMGAGDQSIVIGYACNETDELMPLPYVIAKDYIEQIDNLRKDKVLTYLLPVSKVLVSMNYEGKKPVSIESIVLSAQHDENVDEARMEKEIIANVVNRGKYKKLITKDTRFLINPAGRFCLGGPMIDVGLTGRKIIVDTYGGRARHGGGAFSGKDPSKIDRSGAYFARWIAKHIVALNYAEECEVELRYAIGVANPLNFSINCFGTESISLEAIKEKVVRNFDMRMYSVINELDLLEQNYFAITKQGHFGGNNKYNWECIRKVF